MNWQALAAFTAFCFPALGLLNAWLLNQVRVEIATLKIQMVEERGADRERIKAWAEATFLRQDSANLRFESLEERLDLMLAR
jgi:hypothetical protein